MAKRLHNYLRTYRKRTGLSQGDVAFLLGCQHGAKVSRYERNARQPGLETAVAYEVLFGVPLRELFGGLFEKVEATILKRARVLARKLSAASPTSLTAQRLDQLRPLLSGSESKPADHHETRPRY